jgi:carbon-monoxide dehydrogenase large subunit
MIFPGPYRIPATAFSHRSVFSNTVGRTAYRGPWMFESVAREVVLDIAARRLGIDPVELRRRNILRADELPYQNGNGLPYADISPARTLEQALELLGYEEFRREQAAARAEGRYLGVGTCSYVEPTTPGQNHYASEGATIRIEPSGTVNVYVAGGSTGNSLETAAVQLTADALGVPIDHIHAVQGDTALTPYGAGTGGSRSGSMIAGAVAATASVLSDKLAAIAAHRLEAAPDDIDVAGGRAFVRGTPAVGVTVTWPRSPTTRRTCCPRASRPASRRASATRHRPCRTGRMPRTSAPARSTSPPAPYGCCATSSARTAGR